jgi:hypothetical protein
MSSESEEDRMEQEVRALEKDTSTSPTETSPTEFVKEQLSEGQLSARAAIVAKKYEGKLLPPSMDQTLTSIGQCYLVL